MGLVKGLKANQSQRDKIRRDVDSVIAAMHPQVLEVVGTRDGTRAGVGCCRGICPQVFVSTGRTQGLCCVASLFQ